MAPFLAALVLLAAVGVVLWSAWQPLVDDLKENPFVNVPTVAIGLALVLVPPLAWAIAFAF